MINISFLKIVKAWLFQNSFQYIKPGLRGFAIVWSIRLWNVTEDCEILCSVHNCSGWTI